MANDLTAPIYTDEAAARAHLEELRWPHGPACPHCGVIDQATRLAGEAHRPGLWECRAFFGILKRGMRGVYRHCGEQHFQRHIIELAFRYNNRGALGVNDTMRAHAVLKGITGKRLAYRRTNEAQDA